MKKITGLKSSFFYRLVLYFIWMIIVPVLCSWWIYERVLTYYYTQNILTTQQINLEHSLSLLNSSLNAADNVFTAIVGNQDVVYYLDYRSNKSNMPYSAFRRIYSFCEDLKTMTPYLANLKIYSDSSLLIYAPPLVRMERFPLEEESRQKLENAGLEDIYWKTVVNDKKEYPDNLEEEEFPVIYGYKKLYTKTYLKCIGYVEIRLSPKLLSDYFEMLSRLVEDAQADLSLYQGGTLLYTTASQEEPLVLTERTESECEILLTKNQYRNYVMIPELGLCLVCSGKLSDLSSLYVQNMPSLFISVIIVLLLALFVLFFMNVVSISRRIMAFSGFIKDSNPGDLKPFHPVNRRQKKQDEVDTLIETYNSLIQENNTLISKIEKMELFTQAARYQALRDQIHPHFIYGTLETIRMVALQNKDNNAASMIFSLSSLMRYSMSISTKSVTLRDELEIAGHYLKIQKMRFDDRINYTFQVDESLLEMELPSFILQPILENAIVYGVSQTLEACTLTVDARKEQSRVILSVSNTGLPISPERLKQVNELLSGEIPMEKFQGNRNGLALNNIKERLAIFFDGRASIRLELKDGCTKTVIMIQM